MYWECSYFYVPCLFCPSPFIQSLTQHIKRCCNLPEFPWKLLLFHHYNCFQNIIWHDLSFGSFFIRLETQASSVMGYFPPDPFIISVIISHCIDFFNSEIPFFYFILHTIFYHVNRHNMYSFPISNSQHVFIHST